MNVFVVMTRFLMQIIVTHQCFDCVSRLLDMPVEQAYHPFAMPHNDAISSWPGQTASGCKWHERPHLQNLSRLLVGDQAGHHLERGRRRHDGLNAVLHAAVDAHQLQRRPQPPARGEICTSAASCHGCDFYG